MTKTTGKGEGSVKKPRGTYRERQGKRMLPKAQRRRVTIVMEEIDNPYFNPSPFDRSRRTRRQITAHRNANESPLVLMHHRGTINDVQAEAGLKFRQASTSAMMAGTPSPGDVKERVDGGHAARTRWTRGEWTPAGRSPRRCRLHGAIGILGGANDLRGRRLSAGVRQDSWRASWLRARRASGRPRQARRGVEACRERPCTPGRIEQLRF